MERSNALEKDVVRFDIHQRLQHLAMMGSFILLAITGLPLKFNTWAASQWWMGVWGGIENTRSVHHIAAWVMISVCLYHLLYIAFTVLVLKRPFPTSMIPTPRDARDFFQELGYYIGITQARPQFGRFSWREKFDYWAVFWGMVIIGGSGLILMYPVLVTDFLPGWIIPVALVAHSDEAVLAVAWILIVHFFFGHLAPGVFPLNKSIFTGRVPRERYRLEHPLDVAGLGERVGVAHSSPPAQDEEASEERPR